ncbi:hypothetical protein H0H92_013891 [Tricholoma furcatifolium]|nr:hypothetical protein H0H92_013891 [Tricholoma furcatifolium]
MSQPFIIPPDNKTPPPTANNTSVPPTYATYAQPPSQTLPPGAQPPFAPNATGMPPQPQVPLGNTSPQGLQGSQPLPAQQPQFGAQPPLVNISPQNTGFGTFPGQTPGTMPGQFGTMPGQFGTMPGQQPIPLGTLPRQQVPLGSPAQPGMGTLPQQPINPMPTGPYVVPQPPVMSPAAMQAQLGAHYQATQMGQCAMGNHARQTKHGIAGIIGAIY